ncbi:MAG: hypothetical protein PHS59_01405 [Paludibacter sp.]|nr:hypothetical protein [Paludibacter sp.]
MEEFLFNIWFIVDIGTNLSTHCYIRPYNLSGDDEEKLKVLHILAETDFKSCERISFSEKMNAIYGNGQALEGYGHISVIKNYFELNFEFFVRKAEEQLPVLVKFEGDGNGKNETIKQTLPESPLFVMTMLFENEYGEMKPYTSNENITWIELEKIRLNVKRE